MEKEYLEGCERLYEETHKNDPVFLSNSEGRTIASITNIDCAKDGFIEKFCLYKKESNKVAKVVKTIIFAVGLSILNPITAQANQSTIQEAKQEYINDLFSSSTLYFLGAMLTSGIGLSIILNKGLKKENDISLVLGKLSDEESNDNIEEAVKYLKLSNNEVK